MNKNTEIVVRRDKKLQQNNEQETRNPVHAVCVSLTSDLARGMTLS